MEQFIATELELRNWKFWDEQEVKTKVEARKGLRKKFPDDQIDSIPKGGTNLDYVSHAHITDRISEYDPYWTWRPMFPEDLRSEKLRKLWGWITVCGVTRPCFGDVQDSKHDPEKEIIGDLIRNGAMRFGVGIDMWMKKKPQKKTPAESPRSSHQSPPGKIRVMVCKPCGYEDNSPAFHTIKAKHPSKDGTFDEGDPISKCPSCSAWAGTEGMVKEEKS